jgi:cutinase
VNAPSTRKHRLARPARRRPGFRRSATRLAVTLFGRPSNQFLTENGAPPITIGPLYAPKTLDLCAPDDTICNGAPSGPPSFAHASYAVNGMTGQAADFTVSHL